MHQSWGNIARTAEVRFTNLEKWKISRLLYLSPKKFKVLVQKDLLSSDAITSASEVGSGGNWGSDTA